MNVFTWAPQISPGSTAPALHLISLLLVVYIYDAAKDNFEVLPDMPVSTSTWIHNAQKALQRIQLGRAFSSCCQLAVMCTALLRQSYIYTWLRCNAVDLCCDWRAC